MIESERKNREDRKREGSAAPLLLPQHHLRGRKQRPARSFLIICSICADPTLFLLNVSQRKRFKFYTTCPPLPPTAEREYPDDTQTFLISVFVPNSYDK